MSNDIAIKAEHIYKKYMLRHAVETSQGNLSDELFALKDVSFEIKKGESVGIIGPNGSGKSTLLKILSGITPPFSGKAEIDGRVAGILDIGSGFHPELSGKENIFLNGQILGFSKNEIAKKFDEIVAFSGIEKFIDEPVKNYSNGMYLRLAFSIMATLDFDIYLIDEVLTVGDKSFREKAFDKIQDIVRSNKTLVFVSHEPIQMLNVCQQAILLNEGALIMKDNISNALSTYFRLSKKISDATGHFQHDSDSDFFEINTLDFFNSSAEPKNTFRKTEPVTVGLTFQMKSEENINIGIAFSDISGHFIFGYGTSNNPLTATTLKKGIYRFSYTIPSGILNYGNFTASIYITRNNSVFKSVQNYKSFEILKEENDISDSRFYTPLNFKPLDISLTPLSTF